MPHVYKEGLPARHILQYFLEGYERMMLARQKEPTTYHTHFHVSNRRGVSLSFSKNQIHKSQIASSVPLRFVRESYSQISNRQGVSP